MTLQLPFDLTAEKERGDIVRKGTQQPWMAELEQSRWNELKDRHWKDAVRFIDAALAHYRNRLDEADATTKNRPVTYTQGQHIANVAMLAEVWADLRAVSEAGHEERRGLEKRIAELEARPVFEDAGVWSDESSYKAGQGVTFDGSFWITKRDTKAGEKPGACDGFRLAVKRGRDARSAA
ncbi:MAG: hypothetical protein ACTHM2_06490 [Afipia sp.]